MTQTRWNNGSGFRAHPSSRLYLILATEFMFCLKFELTCMVCEYECPIQGHMVPWTHVVIELVVHSRAPGIYRDWVD